MSAILTVALKEQNEQIYFELCNFCGTVRSAEVESVVQFSLSGVDWGLRYSLGNVIDGPTDSNVKT